MRNGLNTETMRVYRAQLAATNGETTMPKFRIQDTVPCYVTWVYEIEATDAADARRKFENGECFAPDGADKHFIGDAICDASQEIEIDELPA